MNEILEDMLVSLKEDCVTKADRLFIGLNVQFLHKGKVVSVTLSTVELFERHTGNHLKNAILNELKKFNISIQQIYTITTDNDTNFLKAAKLINEQQIQYSMSETTVD